MHHNPIKAHIKVKQISNSTSNHKIKNKQQQTTSIHSPPKQSAFKQTNNTQANKPTQVIKPTNKRIPSPLTTIQTIKIHATQSVNTNQSTSKVTSKPQIQQTQPEEISKVTKTSNVSNQLNTN